MFGTLLRKEVVAHVLSLRFGVTFMLFILLVFASLYVTTHAYTGSIKQKAAAARAGAAHLAKIMAEEDARERRHRLMYREGTSEAMPVQPLSSIAQGLQPFTPVAVNVSTDSVRGIGRHAGGNPLAGLFRVPDLVYVVSVVLSLLAILFAFDAVCGEKESGTLRLMLSNAVPRDSILLAKWIGGYLVLIVPFGVAAAGGLGYAWWRGALPLNAEDLQRVGGLLLVAALYISVFFTLSLAVSAATHRAATALFICLLIWVAWILVVPNLAPVVAKIIQPTPSVAKINAEKRAVDREIDLRMRAVNQGGLWYGKDTQRKREELNQQRDRMKERLDRYLDSTVRRQTALAETLGRLSPSACWTYAAVALADTGPDAYKRSCEAPTRLQKDLRELNSRLRKQERETDKEPDFTTADVPRLRMATQGVGEAVGKTLNDVLVLGILNVVFFMAAFVLFLRYDVR